jgi:cbb3-type cytochrome oxidase cytochrome c subunit
MKGLAPLFLGIFGTFAFSWMGLTVIPNWQIGHLNPQMEEDGTDAYPQPQSGMAERGRRVYAANGCIYCHSQQIRADYAADDIERKWGDRRSAPRDYIFERPVFLGKMRMGPDLANIGARAPAEKESALPGAGATLASSPGQQAAAPAASVAPSAGKPSPPPTNVGSPPAKNASPSPATSPPTSTSPPAASPAPKAPAPPAPNASSGSTSAPAAATASPAPVVSQPSVSPASSQPSGEPPIYSVAWHHKHLYSPRSINVDSNMPSYRFLYQTRQISDAPSVDALQFNGSDAPPEGWEIVPTFDAKCLVAYLMSLNQSHPLKGITSVAAASPSPAASPALAAPGAPAAAAPSPAASPPKGGP